MRGKFLELLKKKFHELNAADLINDFENVRESLISDISSISLNNKPKLIDFGKLDKQLIKNITANKKNVLDGYSFGLYDLGMYTNSIQKSIFFVITGFKKSKKKQDM
ncbi:hypothetical protein BMS3Abin04_01317 [bacterium BMS3Abin04]|nr:hypothetical protein BMS3Abin04_01317 [bacterium BMS3Abin04]